MKIVLIVEDNPAQRQLYADGLRRYHTSFEVLTAEGVAEAADILQDLSVNIVVANLELSAAPSMSGLELLVHLHNRFPDTPAIVLSERPISAGVGPSLGALAKPVGHAALAQHITRALGGEASGVGLADLVGVIGLEQRDCILGVASGAQQGSLSFVAGQLAQASVPGHTLGLQATLDTMLGWRATQVTLQEGKAAEAAVAVPTQPTKETPMPDLRQELDAQAQELLATLQRLQTRARDAEQALGGVLEEVTAFRDEQQRLQQREALYAERQNKLEQRLVGAEQLAQQLLSMVKREEEAA